MKVLLGRMSLKDIMSLKASLSDALPPAAAPGSSPGGSACDIGRGTYPS